MFRQLLRVNWYPNAVDEVAYSGRKWLSLDSFFALLMFIGTVSLHYYLHHAMSYYEQAMLVGAAITLTMLAWHWKALQWFVLAVTSISLIAIHFYGGDLAQAEQNFWLRYLLSSQSAVLWMCCLFVLAMLLYWFGVMLTALNPFATALCWAAAAAAFTALLLRWYESYLLGVDIGHIPLANLYDVFILFCLITTLMYLYYADRFQIKQMGVLVLPILVAAVGFILWYSLERHAHQIRPLVPALQSWWMKIHVPANFIGYAAFSLAAMLALGQLLLSRGRCARYLPTYEVLGQIMYQAIAVGFLFFTLATLLGAMWAADAWGSYWSWDPKEVWALIVWFNYAAWLHMRQVKGWRGDRLAWWALIGLFITAFAFLGVNLFLSGLHAYGEL